MLASSDAARADVELHAHALLACHTLNQHDGCHPVYAIYDACICLMPVCCPCRLAAVQSPTALPSGSDRAAHSVLPFLASSLTAYITTFSPHAQMLASKSVGFALQICLDLVYADDICLMATSAARLQALIDALVTIVNFNTCKSL